MLKFDSVSIGYHKVPLIKNLSVEIPTGSITTIVGPNGCGKTTLISVLNKSSQLFNGSITLDGEDIYHIKYFFANLIKIYDIQNTHQFKMSFYFFL